MGYSGTLLYDGRQWTRWRSGDTPDVAGPWLVVDVHDSEFTTLEYHPEGPGSGVAHLGDTPADVTVDVPREARGLAAWWAEVHGETDDEAVRRTESVITDYLVDRQARRGHDGDEVDEGEVYAEIRTTRLLVALGLPVPDELVR
ncbi:hypothetical protein KIPE111705_22485 [Kibdelosporangium persicum]|uniref:Uncharacterized protein n=1 Tax=Kibdelosporangium persicum TaxID=2698649 RepID=A0ABX2FEN6_9PSEU|nr:hypothetical protein [Kibdelosporangium persicum]NRN69599.1 hypothetical protein [Kibdelosporangium persicum]